MLKEKVYSVIIIDLMHLIQRIREECAEIDGDAILLHQVRENLVKRIIIYIADDGKHIEDVI